MGNYINRDEFVAIRDAQFGESTVRIATRMVGKTAVIELTEFAPELARPVAQRKLIELARAESKAHVARGRAVQHPMVDVTATSELARLDENGFPVTEKVRVRNVTYVVAPR